MSLAATSGKTVAASEEARIKGGGATGDIRRGPAPPAVVLLSEAKHPPASRRAGKLLYSRILQKKRIRR